MGDVDLGNGHFIYKGMAMLFTRERAMSCDR